MAARRKKRFPSQIRYDQNHPSVGVRLPRKEYDRVRKTAERQRKSVSEVIRDALLRHVRSDHRSWEIGYERGCEEAKRKYRIWFYCSRCGEEITILPEDKGHKEIINFMRKSQIAHVECPEKRS